MTAKVVSLATSVSTSELATIGVEPAMAAPIDLRGQPPLTRNGLPRIVYVGAEFCPFCAAQRWGIVVALSRFGHFTGLGLMSSSPSDVYPDTPTLTFAHTTYTSDLVSFTGYETATRDHQPLQKLTPADHALFTRYDSPAYIPGMSAQDAGSIPFVDIGNRFLTSGSSYSPTILAGMSQLDVAQALHDPASPQAHAIGSEANYYVAAICRLTGGDPPATVCAGAGTRSAAARLPPSG